MIREDEFDDAEPWCRKPLSGFVANGETHAEKNRSVAGVRSWCRSVFWRRDVREVGTFKVTPGAPLCVDCIEEVERSMSGGTS